MWIVNDCDASKKRKAFKNSDNGKLRGGGGAREGVGRERKGVEGPTPTDSLADWFDSLGRPAGRPRPTGWSAAADWSNTLHLHKRLSARLLNVVLEFYKPSLQL